MRISRSWFSILGMLSGLTIAGLGLSLVCQLDLWRLLESMRRISPSWIALVLATNCLALGIQGLRWKLILSSARYSSLIGALMISNLVRSLVSRAGELAEALIVNRRDGVKYLEVLGSIGAQKILDLAAILSLATIGICWLPIQSYSAWIAGLLGILWPLCLILMACLMLGAAKSRILIGSLDLSKIPVGIQDQVLGSCRAKLRQLIANLIEGTRGLIRSPSILLSSIALSLIIWLLSAASIYIVFKALEIELDFWEALVGAMLMMLSFMLPAPPAHLATFETYWCLIFMGLGLELEQALSAGILAHLLGLASAWLLGWIALSWLGLSFAQLLRSRNSR